MKKNRYLLCLLLCGLMLYAAVPRLTVNLDGTEGIFGLVWLLFALMVLAGNLTGLLYSPKRQSNSVQVDRTKRKSRSFH